MSLEGSRSVNNGYTPFNRIVARLTVNLLFLLRQTKLASAAAIAATGKNVTIAKCESLGAEQAIRNEMEIDKATVLHS
jgi:hypothetical protein